MSTQHFSLRRATAADVEPLARLYSETARHLGPQVYSAEQVAAWVSAGAGSPGFANYVLGATTWVACDAAAAAAGFCGIDDEGEVRSLYVRHDLNRQGLGSQLLAHALADARARGHQQFMAWATPFSRPLFERAGFTLRDVVREPYQGVVFDRYRMALEAGLLTTT